MPSLLNEFPKAVAPTEAEARVALESSRRLAKYFARKRTAPVKVRREGTGGKPDSDEPIEIPVSAFRLLSDILTQMAQGNAVTLIPVHAELTSQQAADILGVSRPFLVEQLDQGTIPHRKVGTHRRVLFKDLMAYKQQMDASRLKTLDELAKLDQALGLM